MKVSFKTKEQSNREQEKAFLQLSPIERIHRFIDFILYTKDFPTRATTEKSNNFCIVIRSKTR